MKKVLAITGGGTGGHLAIVRAIKEQALAQSIEVIYVGSTYGQDRAWFEEDSDFKACYFFKTEGVVNKRGIKKLLALKAIVSAFFRARRLLKKHRVGALLSVGGYSAAAASMAAVSLKLPFYIHEQNAAIGRLNRMLKPYAKLFFSSYTKPAWDYPVSNTFFEAARVRQEVKSVIFLGGSQGARFINEWALSLAPELKKRGIKIIHQCGALHLEAVQKAYRALGVEVELFGFSKSILDFLKRADLAVARAGASTVWELTALGLPALFIPYPYAANDHQTANAKAHVDQGASWMMQEKDKDEKLFFRLINSNLEQASRKLLEMLAPNGAKKIVDALEFKEYHV